MVYDTPENIGQGVLQATRLFTDSSGQDAPPTLASKRFPLPVTPRPYPASAFETPGLVIRRLGPGQRRA